MQIPVLVGILSTLLSSDELIRADELSRKFEISRRSVYRYIAMLSEGGVPIESHVGRNGGWCIVDNYKLNAAFFDEDEYRRLLLCAQSFSVQDDVTKRAVGKLMGLGRAHSAAALRSDQLIVDSSDVVFGDKLAHLSDCIADKRLCRIEYRTDENSAILLAEPYCLLLKGGVWYVYCFCRTRNAFSYLDVSRIVRLDEDEKFVGRAFRADAGDIMGNSSDKELCEVILSVDGSSVAACEAWLGAGSVAKMASGSYVAKAYLPFGDALVSRILSLGDGVRVDKPQRLRKAVAERAAAIAFANREQPFD